MEEEIHNSKDSRYIPMTSVRSGKEDTLSPDVHYYTNQIVNVIMIGKPFSNEWVLVDAGMPKAGPEIQKVAEKKFGKDNAPVAIILTHGHFDHVGGLVDLLKIWDSPVYAHPFEFLYLKGEKRYPEPDASVEGGLLAKIASIYPHEPINISPRLRELPKNGDLPFLPGWKWIHVPGHAPGQIALFREADRTLIAADAFVTVKQDSLYRVLVQKKEVHGPPVYLTTNWEMARESVQKLADLNPERAVTGHGRAMEGEALRRGLRTLVENFNELAIPSHGKFVENKNKK